MIDFWCFMLGITYHELNCELARSDNHKSPEWGQEEAVEVWQLLLIVPSLPVELSFWH